MHRQVTKITTNKSSFLQQFFLSWITERAGLPGCPDISELYLDREFKAVGDPEKVEGMGRMANQQFCAACWKLWFWFDLRSNITLFRKTRYAICVISDESIEYIFEWTMGYTYFVQELCNRLFASDAQIIESTDCKHVTERLIKERDQLYAIYRNILTRSQFKVLKAIASETSVKQPNASAFIHKHRLTAASTVNRALAALEESELIAFENDEYTLNDIFLMRWLQYQ